MAERDDLFEFPCRYPVKAIGVVDPQLEQHVIDIVTAHAGEIAADDVRTQPSRHGRYVSITVTFTAHSREQLDDLYRALTASEKIRHVF